MRDNPRVRGTNYSFYLSNEQIAALKEAHWRERKSESEIVREAIDDWLKSHAEGNSSFKLEMWQEDPQFKAIPTLLSPDDKWQKYLEQCNNEDLTKIAVKNTVIKKIILERKNKEYREKEKAKKQAYYDSFKKPHIIGNV